jgi:L-alanine-DL-glutamate epimerase-like enolase superfamily enzyme
MIEPLRPYFVEDLVRSENSHLPHTPATGKVPIAPANSSTKWDWNELIEQTTDYARVTIPNVGGITEFQSPDVETLRRLGVTSRTHLEAAMATAPFSGPVLMELVMGARALATSKVTT